MEELLERLKRMIGIFCYVTTAVTCGTALYISIFWGNIQVEYEILWQILGTSFVCSLGMLFLNSGSVSRKRMMVSSGLYYCYVNAVVLTVGYYFEWFYVEQTGMVIGMLILIAVIFFLIMAGSYLRDKALAEIMTKRLQEGRHHER